MVYTINGFSELLKTSFQFKEQSTEEKKLLLLDRCNWFISSIVRDNLSKNEPYGSYVNLHSEILKKYLTNREYTNIEKCLIGLGVIWKNDKYSSTKFSKSFKFTDYSLKLGISTISIQSKKFKTHISKINNERIKELDNNALLKKILENTIRLKVVELESYLVDGYFNPLDYIDKESEDFKEIFECYLLDLNFNPLISFDNKTYKSLSNKEDYEGLIEKLESKLLEKNNYLFKKDRYHLFYTDFKSLNEIEDPKILLQTSINYYPSIAKSGRVYHTFASMPRIVRKCLRTKANELLWEVDMTSAQPSIIFLEWLKYAKQNWKESFQPEYDLCLKLLLAGEIYSYVKQNSKYYNNLDYETLKKKILTAINGKNIPIENNLELKRLFPKVMNWVNNIKKQKGYKHISYIGQSTEANIFVNVYQKIPDSKFALIIHDCILIEKKDVYLVKSLLENRVRELYSEIILTEYSLDKLFKVELVSIPNEELMENKLEKFYSEIVKKEE